MTPIWLSQRKRNTLAKQKKEMRQRRQESAECEHEYRKLCNIVRKAARADKEDWLQEQCQEIERCSGNNRSRQAYKLLKQINRPWKPKQTAIKDKNGKVLQGKEEVKARWTEYCSSLYTESGDSNSVITELIQIAPPPNEDETHYVMYEEIETAVKRLTKNTKARELTISLER